MLLQVLTPIALSFLLIISSTVCSKIIKEKTGFIYTLLRWFSYSLLFAGFFVPSFLLDSFFVGRMGGSQILRRKEFYISLLSVIAAFGWWVWSRLTYPYAARRVLCAVSFPVAVIGAVILCECWMQKTLAFTKREISNNLGNAKGQVAPDIVFSDSTGKQRFLSEFRGRVVLIDFWATWCKPCTSELPALSKLLQKINDPDFVLIYLSSESLDVINKYMTSHQLNGINGNIAKQSSVEEFYQKDNALPANFVVDQYGIVVSAHVGTADINALETAIKSLLRR